MTLPCVASTEETNWASLVGDGDASVDFRGLADAHPGGVGVGRGDAGRALPPRRPRGGGVAGTPRCRSGFISGPRRRRAPVFALPRFVRRRRTAAQMAWGLLRALGLLRHLLAKRLVPSEAAWRALLLAAGQIKATATDLTCEGVRPGRRAGPLPRDASLFDKNRAPDLRALVVGRRGRRRGGRRHGG